jgi:Domain of unknown function (DUF4330)
VSGLSPQQTFNPIPTVTPSNQILKRRMALLDRQGRLFGKFSILDIGAIATILIVLIGLLIVPGNGGSSIAQMMSAENKTVQVEMNVRGLSATNPQNLVKVGDKAKIIIRNQPRGEVTVKKVEISVPKVVAAKADGTAVYFDDPRAISTSQSDLAITLEATAQITNDGAIFANEKVKVGTSIDIEGPKYIIRGSAMAVRY